MVSTDNLCMSCMKEIGNEKQCPYCGYHADSVQIAPYLPVRTVIANRYLVGKLLDYNGEGATYIGWDLTERKAVNIREFIPDSICMRTTNDLALKIMPGSEITFRDCNQSFTEMWNKLMRLRGLSALIAVTDVVHDYNTTFAIYEHFENITLRDYLLSSKTGYIPWERARQLFMPILSTLGTLHSAGIIHRGISPTTLVLGHDGKVRITGFSIWQARTARGDLNAQLFQGYSAIEQYGFDGRQGAWTDIYSFGAVLYRALIGSDPIDATERATNDRLMVPGKFAEQLPAYVINGLINALQILPEDRTRTVEQLRAELSASPAAAAASEQFTMRTPLTVPSVTQGTEAAATSAPSAQKKSAAPTAKKPKKKKGNAVSAFIISIGVSVLVCALIITGVLFVFFRDSINIGDSDTTTVSTSAVAETTIVPDFVALETTYADVSNNPVFTKRFSFSQKGKYSNSVPAGYIIEQSIAPNSAVEYGTEIVLTVSLGKEMITLPDVVGLSYEEAESRLTEIGFVCERKEVANDGVHAAEEVLSMSLISGNTYESGKKVVLRVNLAPEETRPEESETEYLDDYPF